MNTFGFKSFSWLSRAVVVVAALFAQSLFSQTLFSLGTLYSGPAEATSLSFGNDINNAGQVTGYSQYDKFSPAIAFIYSGGVMNELRDFTVPSYFSRGAGINESGQVAGFINNGSFTQAFSSTGGVTSVLGTVDSYPIMTHGFGINDSGQVTGGAVIEGFYNHAFISTGTGATASMIDLGTLGGSFSEGYGINNSGQVIGTSFTADGEVHAFISAGTGLDGSMTDLGTLGGDYSAGRGINNAGQVTGFSQNGVVSGYHAFISTGTGLDGSMTDLGTLGGSQSLGLGINAVGQIVGESTNADGKIHAFIYTGGAMSDLNTLYSSLLSDGISAGFLSLERASAISDNGLITGYGSYLRGSYYDPVANEYARIRSDHPDQYVPFLTPLPLVTRAFVLDTRTILSAPDTADTLSLLALSLSGLALLRRRFGKQ